MALGVIGCNTTTPKSPLPPSPPPTASVPNDTEQPVAEVIPQNPNTDPVDQSPSSPIPLQDERPPLPPTSPSVSGTGNFQIAFSDYLAGWNESDLTPALAAFARNCPIWEARDPQAAIMTTKPEFGQYEHWQNLCSVLPAAPYSDGLARWFFENYFLPSNLLSTDRLDGLLTGYYEPEIDVRARLDAEFSEPILEKPNQDNLRKQTRADIYRNQVDYKALAYGRPIDVFFMQVQGSGRIRFADGTVKRAAYGGNNGYKYKSIGGVLIRRGEVTREQASKQAIEEWMIRSGNSAARNLMNENPRYIYFGLQDIEPGEGPSGSMRAPLTSMGSMAIDPKSRPYGVPVWLETTLPQFAGDYRGAPQSLLVIAQDSGNAIKGSARGDLFFGSGDVAGELAGVMKHDVTMTHLLPRSLVAPQLGLR